MKSLYITLLLSFVSVNAMNLKDQDVSQQEIEKQKYLVEGIEARLVSAMQKSEDKKEIKALSDSYNKENLKHIEIVAKKALNFIKNKNKIINVNTLREFFNFPEWISNDEIDVNTIGNAGLPTDKREWNEFNAVVMPIVYNNPDAVIRKRAEQLFKLIKSLSTGKRTLGIAR